MILPLIFRSVNKYDVGFLKLCFTICRKFSGGWILRQFFQISKSERVEVDFPTVIELTDLLGRRDFLCPPVEICVFLLDAARS